MTELRSSVATCNVMNQGSQVVNGKMLSFCVLHYVFVRILGWELVSIRSLYKVRKVNELFCKCDLYPFCCIMPETS
jgi:hypothetical protein